MKSTEELAALKKEAENMNKKLAELSEEELKQVNGGGVIGFCRNDCGGAYAALCPLHCIFGHK